MSTGYRGNFSRGRGRTFRGNRAVRGGRDMGGGCQGFFRKVLYFGSALPAACLSNKMRKITICIFNFLLVV